MRLKSNYWDVGAQTNESAHEGSYFIPSATSMTKCGSTIAVGANTVEENLRVYAIKDSTLMHLTSITLPDVQSVRFLAPTINEEFKFLASGHSHGIVNLTTIPLSMEGPFQSAEIIKRFNHAKHLPNGEVSMLNTGNMSSTVKSISLSPAEWTSTPLNSLITAYNGNVFLWDSCRSRAPKSIVSTRGVSGLAANPTKDGLVGIVGNFGLSLLDTKGGSVAGENAGRQKSLYVANTQFAPSVPLRGSRVSSSSRPVGSTRIAWHGAGNYLATSTISGRGDVVQVWDVRKLEPLALLEGLQDEVTDMVWIDNTLWTGDMEGCISKWELNSTLGEQAAAMGRRAKSQSFKVTSTGIVAMELVDEGEEKEGIICLDSKFLSLHNRADQGYQSPATVSTESFFSSPASAKSSESDTESFEPAYSTKLQKDIDAMLSNLNYIVRDNTIYL